jgi:non-canonical purine NTP pyrophosphatase (RdgB/HAM1 family)
MMMTEKQMLVLATRNAGKTKEIQELLKDFPVEIKNLDDFGPIPSVEEDGMTFDDNAYKKASFTAKVLGLPALADDSGLQVDALGGAPGVHSARYAGPNASDAENNDRLIRPPLLLSPTQKDLCSNVSPREESGQSPRKSLCRIEGRIRQGFDLDSAKALIPLGNFLIDRFSKPSIICHSRFDDELMKPHGLERMISWNASES